MNIMNIFKIDYNIETLSIEIYLSGCSGEDGIHCVGCHNPQTWDFDEGEYWKTILPYILKLITDHDCMVDNIMIMGGEPMDNNIEELISFITLLKLNITTNKNIWVFTRKKLENIDQRILKIINYIKCGQYDVNQLSDDNVHTKYKIKLASRNQYIVHLNE
jgi:anaerobic ribonucleoside-triphosphate reductase activating protein